MNRKDKTEMTNLVVDALNGVVIPAMEDMENRIRNDMATKDDIARLEKKFDAQQDRLDRHWKTIEKHDKEIKKLQLSIA